mgnify:FL=1
MKLILDHVQKSYGDKEVLKDCSFTFERGKIYSLLGRNGSGKTTLFNCIAQEIDCTGSIQIEKKETMRNIIESDIGYAYSLPILPEFMTGYEFIQFYMDINEQRLEKTINIDDYFDLMRIDEDDRHRLIKGYSHGMKNKLQMLSFIISHPDIILLDEPLTSFDVVVASEMKHLLLQMKEDHILLFSTHVLQLATDLCDEIILLNNGSLTLLDHDLLNSPDFEERVVEMLRDEEHVA